MLLQLILCVGKVHNVHVGSFVDIAALFVGVKHQVCIIPYFLLLAPCTTMTTIDDVKYFYCSTYILWNN